MTKSTVTDFQLRPHQALDHTSNHITPLINSTFSNRDIPTTQGIYLLITMSNSTAQGKANASEQPQQQQKPQVLEEDDEFEDFPVEGKSLPINPTQ